MPAFADETCGTGWTAANFTTTSTLVPRGGQCHAGYQMYSSGLGNFRLITDASGIACPSGQHMSGGTCVNDAQGNCATGFHDATINVIAAVQPLGGTCYDGYQMQNTIRDVAYLISSAAATCGSGTYPTASGCAANPVSNCPTNFFAPVPTAAFVRAGDNDTCATNYSLYDDMDFCRVYLGFNNMPDFCTPQLACTAGSTVLRTGTGVSLPLYRERATVPALNFQFTTGAICYVNVIPGESTGTINLEYNNQIYHGVE